MDWKGKKLVIIRDFMDAMIGLESREEAQEFTRWARLEDPVYAMQNIGYLTGYLDRATADRLLDWCQTAHPIFGTRSVSAEEALEAGRVLGERATSEMR